jgi:uncharacterized protein YjcR
MAETELTSTQIAERLEVSPATVRLWCSQGRFKHARLVEHPRGDYWLVPESELKTFSPPKMGRPPGKVSTVNKAATQPANGSNAALRAAAKAKKKGKK